MRIRTLWCSITISLGDRVKTVRGGDIFSPYSIRIQKLEQFWPFTFLMGYITLSGPHVVIDDNGHLWMEHIEKGISLFVKSRRADVEGARWGSHDADTDTRELFRR